MPAFTWHVSAASDHVISSNFADDTLAAINAIVNAGDGDPGAVWEVANYASTSPKSVLLRRINGAPGRIIFFGQQGSTPNAAAVAGTAAASVLYVGYSATSTSNTPDASFLSGAPLAASDYIPGPRCFGVTVADTWRFSYAEFEDGLYVLPSSYTQNALGVSGAGDLIEDIDGNNVGACMGSGSNNSLNWCTTVSNSGAIIPATIGTGYTGSTQAGLIVRYGGANRSAYRATSIAATAILPKLHNTTTNKAHFLPVPLVFDTSDVVYSVLGKFRQVAFGPICRRETVFTDADGVSAYGHHCDLVPSQSGFWFVDLEV